MAKFLKNFQNHTQYETYTASTVFITPNVSYCKQEDEVHYSSSSEPPTPPVVHVDSVSVSPATVTLNVGATTALTATVLPADADNKNVVWSSSNPAIATVDTNGVVSGIAVGNATITVTTVDGGKTAQCAATIEAQPQPTNFIAYSATSKANVDLSNFTPTAISETYDAVTQTGVIGFNAPVTEIGNYGFYYKQCLTSVVIPDSVTSIGEQAFYECTGLTSVTIPDSVTSIGAAAFHSCKSLPNITIPDSVTSIGNMAFYQCSGLTSINIPTGVTNIENYIFEDCTGLLSIDIPSGVTSIGNRAFFNCSGLTSVTVNAVTPPTLGEYAFSNGNNCPIYVPCESVDTYKSAWSTYADRIQCIEPTPIIYEITVTPSAGKVMKGEEVIFTANVNSSIPSASAVTWNFEDCHLVGTTGNSIAVVYNEDSTTDIMWVTATSVYDESVCDYGTVSIYKAIENLSIYVYEETHNLNEGTVVNCEMYVAPSEDMWAEECCVNSVEWFSSDSSIATVDDNGQVTIQKRPEGVDSVDITCKISDCYGEYVSDPITFTWDDESADPFEP